MLRWLQKKMGRGVVAMAVCGVPTCPTGDFMRLFDYAEVQPPSTLLMPGSMIVVLKRDPIKAIVLCGPRASLGDDYVPQASRTISAELRRLEGRNISMDAQLMDNVKTAGNFSDIESISMTVTNAQIVELTDLDVEDGMWKRDPRCARVVQKRIEANFPVTMVRSALAADVVYSINRNKASTLDARAKIEQMSQLSVQLGGGAVKIAENTISSVGLVWAIRDDEYLAVLSIPDLDETVIEPGTRRVPTAQTAHIIPAPEAPVLMPRGHRPSLDAWVPDGIGQYRTRTGAPIPMRARGAPVYDPSREQFDPDDLHIPIYDAEDDETASVMDAISR